MLARVLAMTLCLSQVGVLTVCGVAGYASRTVYLVVHLFGAVEDVDHDSERSSEVLGRLGLAGARRSGRRAAHRQMQRLRQSYVASAHRIITQMKHASESTLKYDKPERPSATFQPRVIIFHCRMSNYELLRSLVETRSRDVEHYHTFTASRSPEVAL